MRKLLFVLAFMLIGTCSFANNVKEVNTLKEEINTSVVDDKIDFSDSNRFIIIEESKENSLTTIEYYDEYGCMHYVIVQNSQGVTIDEYWYWDESCTDDMAITIIKTTKKGKE